MYFICSRYICPMPSNVTETCVGDVTPGDSDSYPESNGSSSSPSPKSGSSLNPETSSEGPMSTMKPLTSDSPCDTSSSNDTHIPVSQLQLNNCQTMDINYAHALFGHPDEKSLHDTLKCHNIVPIGTLQFCPHCAEEKPKPRPFQIPQRQLPKCQVNECFLILADLMQPLLPYPSIGFY